MPDFTRVHATDSPAPLVGATLDRLARGRPGSLDAHLVPLEVDVPLPGTRARFHCHFVALDGNGRPRVEALVERVCEHVLDYAIPRTEIQKARSYLEETGSTSRIVALQREAMSLFTDLAQTGEGGELLLFTMAETVLRLPQIICKMSLKTSGRMHYHGADGVHAGVCGQTGVLSLYWGESKVNARVDDAIANCMSSLAPFLVEPDGPGAACRRDLVLLSSHADLADPGLNAAIRAYLDKDHPAFNRLKFCGLGLVGFDAGCYPVSAGSGTAETVRAAIARSVDHWRGHAGRRVAAERIAEFDLHLLCVPLPSAEGFRRAFLKAMGLATDG